MNVTNNKFELCYPIMENSFHNVLQNLFLHKNEKDVIYEIRIDYLLNAGHSTFSIVHMLNIIRNLHQRKKFIITIRTKTEGGKISISEGEYYEIIKLIIDNTNMDYYDIEYNFYINNKKKFDTLILNTHKKIILSTHIFDKVYSNKKYNSIFKETLKAKVDIVKFAIMTYTKKEVMEFMKTSRLNSVKLKKQNKNGIFIAMGELGKISRVYPEYTNSVVVFIKNDNKTHDILGQTTKTEFFKCRKLLAKCLKN